MCIAMKWSLNSWMSRNLYWYKLIRFLWSIGLLCLTFRSLVLHVYRSFLIVHSRPMEYRFFSSMVKSVLLSTWFLTSKSHSDIKNANSLHRFHLITLSVFISLPIQYSQTLFSFAAWLCAISGRLDFTSFFCIRPFSTSNPFLNWVLKYRPSLSRTFSPVQDSTPLKNSFALDCGFLYLPPFFL